MIRPLFFLLLTLALLGDARIFLFVMNRIVFGDHREEESPARWMLWAVPPVLLLLTLLFWPLHGWIDDLTTIDAIDRITPERLESGSIARVLRVAGATWLLIAAGVGLLWLIDRSWRLMRGEPRADGTHTLPGRTIALRKAHVPFASLRKLGAHNEVYDIEVTSHEVEVERLPPEFEGYRIAFLTDTHVASFVRRDFYREIVARTMEFDPDLVLLGGDFVSWRRHIPLMGEVLLTGLTARDGVYAVLGNHDYWADADEVVATMTVRGVEFVVNRSVAIRRGEASIALVGIDEVYRGRPDIDEAFAAVEPASVRIGVSHHPDIIDSLQGRRLDLLVCGHTHGGQIRFPFFGPVVVPSRHEARYASGFHRVGEVLLYVSRGIGAIPPLRILCKPEIATFTLRRNLA